MAKRKWSRIHPNKDVLLLPIKLFFFPGATFIKVNKIIFLKSTKVNPFNLGPNVLNKHPFSPTITAGVFWV